jgi:hypothetical protein
MSAQNAPWSDLHTRQRPVGATLSSELQTEEPPVYRLQGREETATHRFIPMYTREEEGARIFSPPPNSSSRKHEAPSCYFGMTAGLEFTTPVCSRLLLPTQNRPAVADSTYLDTWIRRPRQDRPETSSTPRQHAPSQLAAHSSLYSPVSCHASKPSNVTW